jgi:hypothetical protein
MAIFMERLGAESKLEAQGCGGTLHSDLFFAKPVFRRAGRSRFTHATGAC